MSRRPGPPPPRTSDDPPVRPHPPHPGYAPYNAKQAASAWLLCECGTPLWQHHAAHVFTVRVAQ